MGEGGRGNVVKKMSDFDSSCRKENKKQKTSIHVPRDFEKTQSTSSLVKGKVLG